MPESSGGRTLLYLRNNLWVEGNASLLSHEGLLNFANNQDCNFIPLTDVKIYTGRGEESVALDFISVSVRDVSFLLTDVDETELKLREKIQAALNHNDAKHVAIDPKHSAEHVARWLEEEVAARLATCAHILGNGRTDDRANGVKMVMDELLQRVRQKADDLKGEGVKPPE